MSHPYAKTKAFERLMILIATLVQYPGVGCPSERLSDRDRVNRTSHHNALAALQNKMQQVAQTAKLNWPPDYPSLPTLRKDLERLRDYNILERRMYRWGYYLGTGAMTKRELQMAFQALQSQAQHQGDPQVRRVYEALSLRLRGFELDTEGDFFYPVRQNLSRTIEWTDPQEMMACGENRHTLFHHIATLEDAIAIGQPLEIARERDLYNAQNLGIQLVWPLQLIYRDIAWYLLYECCHNQQLVIGRLSRYSDYCKVYPINGRGVFMQKQSLDDAYRLLQQGWGLYLGEAAEQEQELTGELDLMTVRVRFFPPVSRFIAEGDLRHPQQKLRAGPIDEFTGKPQWLDYTVELPPRSLSEFRIWLQRYGDKVQILSPPELAQDHYQAAIALVQRYKPCTDE